MRKKQEEQEETPEVEDVEEVSSEKPAKKAQDLSDLPGIGPATVEKLQSVGYRDLMSVAVATPGEIIDATGMTQAAAKKVIATARASLDMGFESGIDLLERRSKVIRISTGSKAFDDLMAGGFETGCITECFGQYGSSKTQLAHQLAVNVIKMEPSAYVVYIDTENTFRPERITEFAKGAGLNPEDVLKNIKVARAYNSDHQMLLAEKVEDLIKVQGLTIRLIIVDSLTAHFRAEFVGRGTLADRQQKLNKHMHILSRLANTNNLCVYVTNQVMAKPDTFFGDPTEAIGGHIVAHNSTFRIYLRKGKKGTRVAKLVDAPNLCDGECQFIVTTPAITDV
ncbi:MAG: DNA repair and recombination protein RadA [Nanoarchaeota archaeon]|nr:DNA repair and recombination protein RadA [Nanoarchaeota archaeon]MBU1005048.1 DNA repair and recombination protein RadA [Nanoarchaeota archaeon]MBU1946477.1 DNA repair and recombination protein RadA [Nanoarchaeota archaeon]